MNDFGDELRALDDQALLARWTKIAGDPDVVAAWPQDVRSRAIALARAATPWIGASIDRARREMSPGDGTVSPIEVAPGTVPAMVTQAVAALRAAGAPIFERGGQLVRPVVLDAAERVDGVARAIGAAVLRPVTATWLVHELASVARWQRYDARTRGLRDVDPPMRVAEIIVDAPDIGRWPPLKGIIRAPLMLLDGRIVDRAGYDGQTGILADWNGDWPIVSSPTKDDAADALHALHQLTRFYPFCSAIDRATADALLIGTLERPALPAAPGVAITSPEPGTGKSKLAAAAAILATGAPAAVMDWGDDPAESAKRIDAAMVAGDQVLALDNVERPIEGAAICQLLSEDARRLRLLGATTVVTVPCTATVVMTGVNICVRGDAVRRTLVCQLDAGVERPELRAIPQDFIAEVRERRRELVAHALTIMRAYALADWPDLALPVLGGYDEWSRLVRHAIVWAGGEDACRGMERLRDDDPHRAAMRTVYAAWHAAVCDVAVTAAEMIARAQDDHELRTALQLVAAPRGTLDTRALGSWCRYHRDRRSAGYKLEATGPDPKSRTVRWRVTAG